MKSEAGEAVRNYLSYKDDIDRAIKQIKEYIDEVNHPSGRKIEYWQDGDQAFVVRLLKRNGGTHHNRGIILNFKGTHFEIVFWSSYDDERFIPGGLYGTKRIRTDRITKSRLESWLKWLNTGEKEPVRILDAEDRKSAKYTRGCLILVAAVLIIGALIKLLEYLLG
jgi:hypothetical protein